MTIDGENFCARDGPKYCRRKGVILTRRVGRSRKVLHQRGRVVLLIDWVKIIVLRALARGDEDTDRRGVPVLEIGAGLVLAMENHNREQVKLTGRASR